jgi:CxxC motif-containing protein
MKELTCIVCPRSCHIRIEKAGDEWNIEGNQCKRGETYAINEMTEPMRMLTTTVKITGAGLNRIPVITAGEIPKTSIKQALDQLYHLTITAPVKCDQVVLENLAGTGVNVLASRSLEKES